MQPRNWPILYICIIAVGCYVVQKDEVQKPLRQFLQVPHGLDFCVPKRFIDERWTNLWTTTDHLTLPSDVAYVWCYSGVHGH